MGKDASSSSLPRWIDSSLRVGLTGGIACGKSHATRVLAELGAHVIDADLVAHRLILRGAPAYQEIVDHFGSGILGADQEIERKRLGSIIFADAEARARLNAIVHPRVIEEENRLSEQITARVGSCIIVVDAALMIEAGYHKRFERLVVVHCKPELQLHRLMARDGLSLEEARQRVSAQMPLQEKLKLANHVIETSGTYRQTRVQIVAVFALLAQALDEKIADN